FTLNKDRQRGYFSLLRAGLLIELIFLYILPFCFPYSFSNIRRIFVSSSERGRCLPGFKSEITSSVLSSKVFRKSSGSVDLEFRRFFIAMLAISSLRLESIVDHLFLI